MTPSSRFIHQLTSFSLHAIAIINMSEADDDEYAYSSDEDGGYPIDDESNMDWRAVSDNPNAAPTKYSPKRTCVERHIAPLARRVLSLSCHFAQSFFSL